MAKKGFLSWVGFTSESDGTKAPISHDAQTRLVPTPASSAALDRIRELEAQLADLRSRRDITALTREEFEILATETALNLVKTAQHREKSASNQAAKVLADSSRIAQEAMESAQAKAKTIIDTAESRGRKLLSAAESEGGEIKVSAEKTARSMVERAKREAAELEAATSREVELMLLAKKREANAITSSAKHEAEALVAEAAQSVSEYRNWLSSVVAETERLYKVQTQSLASAQQAIEQSRQRLGSAFEKLSNLTVDIANSLGEGAPSAIPESPRPKKAAATRKSAPAKSATKKVVKKSPRR